MFSFVILLNQLRNIAMKRIITLFGAFALLTNLNSFSYAQALEDFKPSSVNQLGKAYPQVNSEGRVRAQLYAPEAKKVQLDIGGVKYDMIKNEQGFWTGESERQQEGFHYYQLNVDGHLFQIRVRNIFMVRGVGGVELKFRHMMRIFML